MGNQNIRIGSVGTFVDLRGQDKTPGQVITGFLCPDWAKPHWNPAECKVTECTDGTWAVIDHSLNGVTIYVGNTKDECSQFLSSPPQR